MVKDFKNFDAIIIGAGQGGTPLATTLAKAGWQVALVERNHVGGTCINYGCTPTKTMIASARIAYLIKQAENYGINLTLKSIDLSKIVQRKQEIVDSFRDGSKNQLLSTSGLSFIEGEASFIGKKEIVVSLQNQEKKYLKAEKIIINTGTSPAIPEIDGLANVKYLDSTAIMELTSIPEHLLIIGGGYVGLEFGQMFNRFGSKVTIIQRNSQLLPNEDKDISQEISSILQKEGLSIHLETEVIKVNSSEKKKISLILKEKKKEKIVEGTHLLVATGRIPNTSALDLNATGIKTAKDGSIPVNISLETIVPGIFAIGDVNGGPKFTHISYDDFRIITNNILHKKNTHTTGRLLPYVVFIDPQLGRIGLTEKKAKDLGYDYQVAKMPMSWVARAIETGETAGLMKVLVDSSSKQILGAAILGIEGGEIMAILQVAMMGKLPYTELRDAIFAHPSISEALNNLFEMLED